MVDLLLKVAWKLLGEGKEVLHLNMPIILALPFNLLFYPCTLSRLLSPNYIATESKSLCVFRLDEKYTLNKLLHNTQTEFAINPCADNILTMYI